MTQKNLRFRWAAFALAAILLLPPAAAAGEPRTSRPSPGEPGLLALVRDFVSSLFLKNGETENRGQIDPDGLTTNVDPGGENRGQMDPNG
jgi:hypothetical protein